MLHEDRINKSEVRKFLKRVQEKNLGCNNLTDWRIKFIANRTDFYSKTKKTNKQINYTLIVKECYKNTFVHLMSGFPC